MKFCTFCLGPRKTDRWRVIMLPLDGTRPMRRVNAEIYFCTRACLRWWLRRYE